MKTEKLVDTVRKVLLGEAESGDKEAYQKFFNNALKKFKIKSPADLKDDEAKKKFYDYIDKNWKGDHEEQKEGIGDLSDKDLKSKMKGASTQKETDAACGEMGKRRLKMEKKNEDTEVEKAKKYKDNKKDKQGNLVPNVTESAALQLKMAFDDAKIKIKGTKGGKLVISKGDKKKVEKIIAKQMKNPSDAKRVLGSQIVFEDESISKLLSHVRNLMSK